MNDCNATLSNHEKNNKLKQIEREIFDLESSPLFNIREQNGYKPVFGDGNPDAKVMFIGEAPGAKEAKTGLPFVGRAGIFLNELLKSIGLERSDVYITNIVKDRPPKNRDPRTDEIKVYAPFLQREIDIIQPQVIATLGRFAMRFILVKYALVQQKKTIGELHGKVLNAKTGSGQIKILPLYHPAAVFYNRSLEEHLITDFMTIKKLI